MVSEMDKLLMANHLKDLLQYLQQKDKTENNSSSIYDSKMIVNTNKIMLYYFLIEIGQNPNPLIDTIFTKIICSEATDNGAGRELALHLLINKRLLSL